MISRLGPGLRAESQTSLKSCLKAEGSAHPVNNEFGHLDQIIIPGLYGVKNYYFVTLKFEYRDHKSGIYLPTIGKYNI